VNKQGSKEEAEVDLPSAIIEDDEEDCLACKL
jgi:hypothetical protein